MERSKNMVSRGARVLVYFGVGCLLHVLGFCLSGPLTRAVLKWHRAYDEITIFVFIGLWPVYIVLIGIYLVLAVRVRPSTLWAIAAVLGLSHGVGFTLLVYFENNPPAEAFTLRPDDVVMTVNPACADKALPEDSELRRLITADRSQSPSLSVTRGDSAIEYDFDGDSKAELIIPVRCYVQGSCFWIVVATAPTRELGQLYGELLFVVRSEGPWPDVVGYDPERASLMTHRRVFHGQAHGYGYSLVAKQDLNGADAKRFMTAAPIPQCGREGEPKHE